MDLGPNNTGRSDRQLSRGGDTWAAPRKAHLFFTGDDSVRVYVNGHQVAVTDSREMGWKQVRRVSVASLLHAGRNVIAAQGINTGGGGAGILVQLETDGKMALGSSAQWKILDSADPPATWTDAAFDSSSWRDATVVAAVGQGPWGTALVDWPQADSASWYLAHLSIRPRHISMNSGQTKLEFVRDVHVPIAIPSSTPDREPVSLRIDFGQEIAGRLIIEGTSGALVRVTTENRLPN